MIGETSSTGDSRRKRRWQLAIVAVGALATFAAILLLRPDGDESPSVSIGEKDESSSTGRAVTETTSGTVDGGTPADGVGSLAGEPEPVGPALRFRAIPIELAPFATMTLTSDSPCPAPADQLFVDLIVTDAERGEEVSSYTTTVPIEADGSWTVETISASFVGDAVSALPQAHRATGPARIHATCAVSATGGRPATYEPIEIELLPVEETPTLTATLDESTGEVTIVGTGCTHDWIPIVSLFAGGDAPSAFDEHPSQPGEEYSDGVDAPWTRTRSVPADYDAATDGLFVTGSCLDPAGVTSFFYYEPVEVVPAP